MKMGGKRRIGKGTAHKSKLGNAWGQKSVTRGNWQIIRRTKRERRAKPPQAGRKEKRRDRLHDHEAIKEVSTGGNPGHAPKSRL